MSIGPKSWASSSSFYKRSSEFLDLWAALLSKSVWVALVLISSWLNCELRFCLNGKLKNMTFFSANYLKSDNFKGNSVIFCRIWIGLAQIVPKGNLWVKLRLKIFVKSCGKSIFERILKMSLMQILSCAST
jgi:hypothetical protein